MEKTYYGEYRKMKKIAIFTWHYYENFGSALQSFALQKTLENIKLRMSML